MTSATDTYVLLRAFVDELARCGMRAACTSPGSRSTPIVLSLVREPRLRCYSHIDERCAGFFALGLAKASGLPVAVACTSGTAAAELAPAVIEAHEARVPLIVLTADRPPELREVGAGQTIDQLKLYGSAAKWFFEVGVHDAGAGRARWVRTLACRAYWTALDGRQGPVHLNWPLREPLVTDEPLPSDDSGRADGAAWVRARPRRADAVGAASELDELIGDRPHGVIVAGRYERAPAPRNSIAALAMAAGYPVFADPLSGARTGDAAVAHYDALLRDAAFAAAHAPDVVIRVGDLPTSKPLRTWLAGLDRARQIALDPEAAWQDPDGVLEQRLAVEPTATLETLAARLGVRDPGWLARWRAADDRAAEAIAQALGDRLSEPRVAAELGARLPAHATLFVASSMPVRDVESFFARRDDAPRVLANRGASGIDGTVSSAFGVAAAGDGPVVLLIGDVALAHDIGGLIASSRLRLALTIVLLNNGGGGIFDFLAVASQRDAYEQHVATPPGLDFARAAALYGVEHEHVEDLAALRAALDHAVAGDTARIIEVPGERAANVAMHERVWEAVAQAAAEQSRAGVER